MSRDDIRPLSCSPLSALWAADLSRYEIPTTTKFITLTRWRPTKFIRSGWKHLMTRTNGQMLAQCWGSVADADPTLCQHLAGALPRWPSVDCSRRNGITVIPWWRYRWVRLSSMRHWSSTARDDTPCLCVCHGNNTPCLCVCHCDNTPCLCVCHGDNTPCLCVCHCDNTPCLCVCHCDNTPCPCVCHCDNTPCLCVRHRENTPCLCVFHCDNTPCPCVCHCDNTSCLCVCHYDNTPWSLW